jgi:ribosomal protein L29
MKMDELTQLSEQELMTRLSDEEREFFALRASIFASKEMNHQQLKQKMSIIARIKTALREKADLQK